MDIKGTNYKTKQRCAILEYLEKNKDKELSANDILEHVNKTSKTSQTTIYRYLNRLEGSLKKFYSEEDNMARFQYVSCDCNMHYHLKCEKCGEIIHIDNDIFSSLENSVSKKYNFKIDNIKTILLGVCKRCQKLQ